MKIFLLLVIFGCTSKITQDYDHICSVFQKYESNPETFPKELSMLSFTISEEVLSKLSSKEAKKVWEVLAYVSPTERYSVLQESAAENLGHSWSCPAIKNFYSK